MIPVDDRTGSGSFFCTVCGKEYNGVKGKCTKCKSKGSIKFINENDSRYAKFALMSPKKGNGDCRIAYYRPFIKNPNSKEEIGWL